LLALTRSRAHALTRSRAHAPRRLWSAGEQATAISLVSNATVSTLIRLCGGAFGARPTLPSHTIIAVNPSWTQSADVGQLWDRTLRADAAQVLEKSPVAWEEIYTALPLRRRDGGTAILLRAYPGPWRALSLPEEQLLAQWEQQPSEAAVAAALRAKK
jgi:hypothetical protein